MRAVVLEPLPVEIERLIERRRALGQDMYDEVWVGVYHLVPAPDAGHGTLDHRLARVLGPLAEAAGLVGTGPVNIGVIDDFRVPDQAYHRGEPRGVWLPTAALVVEIQSPHDETWEKFDFYAAHDVDEICVANPQPRSLQWFVRDGDQYVESERSPLLNVSVAEVASRINRPG
jgi:hypothetical protein